MRRLRADDGGFTLAEMLIALLILGVGAVAMVGAMGSLVRSSVTYRGFSATDNYTKTYLEGVKQKASSTAWSCNIDLTPVGLPATDLPAPEVVLTWIDGTAGSAIPPSTKDSRSACEDFAYNRCPAEPSAPTVAECIPGAVRVQVSVGREGTLNSPSVEAGTETVVRRGNA